MSLSLASVPTYSEMIVPAGIAIKDLSPAVNFGCLIGATIRNFYPMS